MQSTDARATRGSNERVRRGRETGGIGGGRSSGREPGRRVYKVCGSGAAEGVGAAVLRRGGRVDGSGLGAAGLEQGSDERVVDFLSVLLARVEEPDEEGEFEGKVLGNVVEDDSEGGGFEEVEETD